MSQKIGTKKSSTTTRPTNKLLEETFNNIAKDLVGKIIRSKNDPLKYVLFDQPEEKLVGMIVKVEREKMPHRPEITWVIHVLVDESVDVLFYKNLGKFIEDWEVLNP